MISKEILKQRKTGIGGTDVSAILGLSKYKTAFDVYLEKTEDVAPLEDNEYMYWGREMEPLLANKYAQLKVVKLIEPTEMFFHKEHKFLIANPDRMIVGEDGILECKTCSSYRISEWGQEGTDSIPTEYLLQVAHYRYICNVKYVDVAVLLGGNDFRIYRYFKNETLEEKVINKLSDFWNNNVLKRIAPEPQNLKDVEAMFKTKDLVFVPDSDLIEKINQLSLTNKKISELKEESDKLKFEIASVIKDSNKVVNDNGKTLCTYKEVKTNRFDSTRFKIEHEDLYKQYIKESTSRTFRLIG